VIPNAVPSRANIDAGARTLWSNLYSGLFLLLFAVALPTLLARIPLAAIAAILIYIGWRLCEPALFWRMATIGRDRFLVFTGTVLAILLTDLLVGMLIGVVLELMLLVYLLMPSVRYVLTGRMDLKTSMALLATNFAGLFRSSVIKHRSEVHEGRTRHVLTMGSLVGFNLLPLEKQLAKLPAGDGVVLRFTESARIIDHTAAEFLQHSEEEFAGQGRPFLVEGLSNFYRFSAHPLAARMQEPQLAQVQLARDERAQRMDALAQRLALAFDPATHATINRHDFTYLRRGDQREENNLLHGDWAQGRLRIFDYGHTSAPDYHAVHRHTLVVIEPGPGHAAHDFVLTPGHYLERYLVHLSEREDASVPAPYRLYLPDEGAPLVELSAALAAELDSVGPLYVESRGGALLAFSPNRALEDAERIEAIARWLTAFAQASVATKAERA
jgi:carbonic anhydrase